MGRSVNDGLGMYLISGYEGSNVGFDHGVGHSLLLLYDAKTPFAVKRSRSSMA